MALRLPPLDVSRDKVYEAQEKFFAALTPGKGAWAHPSMSLERAEEIVCELEDYFKVPPIGVVKKNQPMQAAAYSRKHRIIRLWGLAPKWVILHEFAHALVDWRLIQFANRFGLDSNDVAQAITGHGPAFLQAFIDVVDAHWGHVEGLSASFETFMIQETGVTPSSIETEWFSNLENIRDVA